MAESSSSLPNVDVSHDNINAGAAETSEIRNVPGIEPSLKILAALERIEKQQIAHETRVKAS
jgi:hypothetical protein